MLMYGKTSIAREVGFTGIGVIFNLTSMAEDFIQLPLLIPPNDLPRSTERDFDIAYANYIMNNDIVFIELFKIIYNLYMGIDVFLVIDDDQNWAENILESLLKLIQQRYGYNAVYVNNEEDYIYARNNLTGKFASGYGIYNLDHDKERFAYIIEKAKQKGTDFSKGIVWEGTNGYWEKYYGI